MSSGAFPTYNSGKVIGEINWFESAKMSEERVSYPSLQFDDIVIPVNRNELNECFIAWHSSHDTTKPIEFFTKDNISDFNSSEQNNTTINLIGFLRKGGIGKEISIKENGNTSKSLNISIISENADSVTVRCVFKYSVSSTYYVNGILLFGWR